MKDLDPPNSVESKVTEFEVTDFGPIIEAKMDLRPLTVFIGPSGSGKSYLAILIYAFHRSLNKISARTSYRPRYFNEETTKQFSKKDIKELIGFVQEISPRKNSPDQKSLFLPKILFKSIELFNQESFSQILEKEIMSCFGVNKFQALIRKKSTTGTAQIIGRKCNSTQSDPFVYDLTIKQSDIEFKTMVPQKVHMNLDKKRDFTLIHIHMRHALQKIEYILKDQSTSKTTTKRKKNSPSSYIDDINSFYLQDLTASVIYNIIKSLNVPTFYLPASRTGIMHAHHLVVASLLESATLGGIRNPSPMPKLSSVVADFLQHLITLPDNHESQKKKSQRKNDFGKLIEKNILDGMVKMNKSEVNYPSFTYQPKGWKESLPLMNSSSMVSELAPLVLYLRYIVLPGDMLIIEEPEAHLHPAMQVKLIEQLANLVNQGIKVLITTHSEWLLEGLANIVNRSKLSENKDKIDDHDISLNKDQVGVWLLQSQSDSTGSKVKEISIDEESGLYRSGFDEVAKELHNDWAKTYNQVGESQ